MSVHVLSWVLRHSEEKLGRRLVLLVLADHAREDGTMAWPSVDTIAREARLSKRQAQYALRGLEEAGSIEKTAVSASGTNVYRVIMRGADIAPAPAGGGAIHDVGGAQSTTSGVHSIAPEPSLEPSREPSVARRSRATPLAPVGRPEWDALVEVTDATVSAERGRLAKALQVIRAESGLDGEPLADEIRRRADVWHREWAGRSCTPTALSTHWNRLGALAGGPAVDSTMAAMIGRAKGGTDAA